MAKTTFYRPVRNYPASLPNEQIQIEAPPQMPQNQGGKLASIVQYLYPVSGMFIMLISMLSYLSFANGSPNPIIIIAEICIMPLSLGIMFLSMYFQRRAQKTQQKAITESYRGYLDSIQRRLTEIRKLQVQRNTHLYPEPSLLPTIVAQRQALWERRPADEDFLSARIGVAPIALCCAVNFKEDYKASVDPSLLQEVRDLVNRNSHIDGQPLVISLRKLGSISVVGPNSAARTLARSIVSQLVTFHTPDEVSILTYFPPSAAPEWDWLKWLPHTHRLRQVNLEHPTATDPLCLLADTVDDLRVLFETQIKPEIELRYKMLKGKNQDELSMKFRHLIFILDGFTPGGLLRQIPELEQIMRDAVQLGITVISLVDTKEQEPPVLQARLALATTFHDLYLSYQETFPDGKYVEFIALDKIEVSQCERIARSMAPLHVVDGEASLDFSQNVSLLQLHNIPAIETLQVADLWRKRNDKQLLRVPIGVQKNGPLILDVKEMAAGGFGPHGLVIGATGSGKSELLRTVVTSLALTHDPYTVNFVLIDFKAGAAFAEFADLPHVAGIITNLENDPLLISRMYDSLLGEQQRRQNLLSQVGAPNIIEYHKKWRNNPHMEPMPYLIIIVDEFAQLIANYEDFLALFTKFGQVGRSLGMHMMLATQRVDEGRIRTLEGHLRYRIALRTFKADESSAVIGTHDAYYLPPSPGSGYFKVDEDIYTSFKTALISLPYVPLSQRNVDPITLFRTFTATGQLLSPQTKDATQPLQAITKPRTEMQMVIENISQAPAPANGWRVHAVWQAPLRERIALADVLLHCGQGKLDGSAFPTRAPFGPLCVPIGMIDRPAKQVQDPLLLDFSGLGGHLVVVGAPQAGKSTLLRTLITSLIVTHTPQEVQIYGIDFGGGLLRIFEHAPHVGAICSRADRDKQQRVLRRMQRIVAEREALFAQYEIDGMASYRHLRQQGQFSHELYGDVFLFIDNFGQFQSEGETNDPESVALVTSLIASGLTYGVHVILTANQWTDIRTRLRSNIGTRLELRLNDTNDSEFDRKVAAMIAMETPGRGLLPEKLQFQTALPIVGDHASDDVSSFALQKILETLIQRVHTTWKGPGAPKIRVLPQEVRWADMPVAVTAQSQGIPLGLEETNINPVFVDMVHDDAHFLILGDKESGKTTLLRTWITGIQRYYTPEQAQIIIIDYRKSLLSIASGNHVLAYVSTLDKIKECVQMLNQEFERRLAKISSYPEEAVTSDRTWNGTHYYLFVDDYEMVATQTPQSGNPLNSLEALLQPAKEVGFHLILARRIVEIGRANYDPIYRGIKNMEGPGFIMRGDPVEGRQVLHKQSASDKLPAGRGYMVRRGAPAMQVQITNTEVQ
ncbi:type VII secretion protein EccCa [Dictyobacter arantiisoli]|uniref:Type VII secretion protein EccC n=1 Tax=Dictyobacter arantiisoli TaxID=2014874 RepID=A0A5A5TG84_9CHLR|nr:type VII secretion protein EccCa [Dictyobacter arantiisoli]GCF10019.1 type VII secretion protein EccC [Dictyobacter arantiisoli]